MGFISNENGADKAIGVFAGIVKRKVRCQRKDESLNVNDMYEIMVDGGFINSRPQKTSTIK